MARTYSPLNAARLSTQSPSFLHARSKAVTILGETRNVTLS